MAQTIYKILPKALWAEALAAGSWRGGALFPHLYAPLAVALASWVTPLPLGSDGAHTLPNLAG